MDFIKIMQADKIIGVLNLNNMVPILNEKIQILNYREIDKYREFETEKEKRLYISFLSFELNLINQKVEKIRKNATKLYNEKINNPNSNISKRCCNFKLLEEKCVEYSK